MMSISVCMASYNGELYIERQINSILSELSINDELIIIDDCSLDNTAIIINNFQDKRIKLFTNSTNSGEIFSFNRAITLSKNNYIFLSDQDDVWIEGRVNLMKSSLMDNDLMLSTSNFSWIDGDDIPISVLHDGVSSMRSDKHTQNIIDIFKGKTNYFGCAMAFKREFISTICPIPSFVESHDLWIAIASNCLKSNLHLDDITFLKRKHDSNVTSTISKRSIARKLFSRIIFILSVFVISKRILLKIKL